MSGYLNFFLIIMQSLFAVTWILGLPQELFCVEWIFCLMTSLPAPFAQKDFKLLLHSGTVVVIETVPNSTLPCSLKLCRKLYDGAPVAVSGMFILPQCFKSRLFADDWPAPVGSPSGNVYELLYGSLPALSGVEARRNMSPGSAWYRGKRLMRMCSSGLPDRRGTAEWRRFSLPKIEAAGGEEVSEGQSDAPSIAGRQEKSNMMALTKWNLVVRLWETWLSWKKSLVPGKKSITKVECGAAWPEVGIFKSPLEKKQSSLDNPQVSPVGCELNGWVRKSVVYFHIASTHAAFHNLFVRFIYVTLLSFALTAPALRGKITFLIIGHSPLKLNKAMPFCQTPPLILSLSPWSGGRICEQKEAAFAWTRATLTSPSCLCVIRSEAARRTGAAPRKEAGG